LIFGGTPSQTVGPFFAIGLPWPAGPHAVTPGAEGAIRISGSVYDGVGELVPDHVIETWQADPAGRFADLHDHGGPCEFDGFRGFARSCEEDGDGSYEVITLKPGRVPNTPDEHILQAPHIDLSIFARGMLHRCVTRIYFADEAEANETDPLLATVPKERRQTLLARAVEGGYRFDIHLQGTDETVFFAI
jgi:protocatechuate 3,4-dioxygenase alpha subunit